MKMCGNLVVRLLLPLFVFITLSSCSDTPLEQDGSNSTDDGYSSEDDQHVDGKDDDSESGDDEDSDEDGDADNDGIPDDEDDDDDNDGIDDDEDTDDDGDGIHDDEDDDDSDDDSDDSDNDDDDKDNDDDDSDDDDDDSDDDDNDDDDSDADNDGIPDDEDDDDDNDGIDDDEDTDDDGDGESDGDDDDDSDDDGSDNDDGEDDGDDESDGDGESDGDDDDDDDDDETDDDEEEDSEPEHPFINSDAWIDKEYNDYGIQGYVYAFGDGEATDQSGNPWDSDRKAYCISGTTTGNDGDWGAGIGFDMYREPTENEDDEPFDKERYDYSKQFAGFKIKLEGHSTSRMRVQFIVNEPQTDNQPYVEAHPDTEFIYPVGWAQIPSSWDVDEAGLEVTDSIYAVQIFIEGDVAGPFDICITEYMPVTQDELDAVSANNAASGYHGYNTIPDAILEREYDIWKRTHFHDCGSSACIPREEDGGGCISEGIGYGMLITVGFDDQEAFNKLWTYYNDHKGQGNLMGWKSAVCGGNEDSAPATDGDIDVAMALLQAACKWGGNYEQDAKGVLSNISGGYISSCSGGPVITPGAFGGCSQTNPSYHSPGYFRVFAEKTGDSVWSQLVDSSYTMTLANQDRHEGTGSDWCDSGGNPTTGAGGEAVKFGPDGSRIPWRMAIDYMWNGEDRAKQYLDRYSEYVSRDGVPRTFTPNSNFRGGSAFSGMPKDAVTAQSYTNAWIMTAVDDENYFPGTMRLVYMLLAANKFPKGC